jgi:hypothetical protein
MISTTWVLRFRMRDLETFVVEQKARLARLVAEREAQHG